ncbi:hypothetical protein Sango_2483800 [Sesamum angolense]|uniref:Uncharacterized protein n=1 Tax=Sesamum angolense TaxID=2727404 RepID=A0AAE2BI04_9LAMI|nr:hypothetical protein Sango_2483800 [Sesamum angolense]
MLDIPCVSAMGSIQYVVQCTRPDVAYALSVISGYQTCIGESDDDDAKSQSGFAFKLNGGVVKSSKEATTADSTMEVEHIATKEAVKEAVWRKNYIQELDVILALLSP